MKFEAAIFDMWVLVNMIDALCIEERRPAFDAMYFITFL
jgi:hypothetical protein